ncbi:MAG: NTP transferase domain-containing protein [Myxococcota bacterium]|nr:NTP transferase domain-containing protein [Myxococcota bacterium]
MKTNIDQAVILAAGKGTRIRRDGLTLPKPLVPVGGITLIKRAILTAKREGVEKFVIVVGCDGDRVKAALENDNDYDGLELIFVENERYDLSNGVSVLQAQPHVQGEFFLMMSDHIVDPSIYRTLQNTPAGEGLVLAVDKKLDTIFDMDDATKVKTSADGRIDEIGKEINDFDAVDTGVFRCSQNLFRELVAHYDIHGDASLSNGVQQLAARGHARTADVGPAWWQDVDTPETIKHAHKLLFASLTKPIDGIVSKNINRRFSKLVTRMLMNTAVTPNHMTTVGLLVGLAASVVTAMTTASSLWLLALGGVLYQLSSMLDGCDGEIARLKFKHSDSGEWYDTVSDDVINLCYQVSVGYALFQITGNSLWLQIGVATFILGWGVAAILYRKLLTSGSGTHLALDFGLNNADAGLFTRVMAKLEFVAHRDFYALLLMVLAIIGPAALKVALVMAFATVFFTGTQWFIATLGSSSQGRRRKTARAGG